ncbi:hypothetical protein RRG08_060160 [Elysia crispata]|uniref:Uncharacterized protein n=1 Tax=Elysia crispata TaxID=231223 RepID=A0AAE0ZZM3_9GAST|nr:hypothetical protein RRG08_060160 [Elysia crispata]
MRDLPSQQDRCRSEKVASDPPARTVVLYRILGSLTLRHNSFARCLVPFQSVALSLRVETSPGHPRLNEFPVTAPVMFPVCDV